MKGTTTGQPDWSQVPGTVLGLWVARSVLWGKKGAAYGVLLQCFVCGHYEKVGRTHLKRKQIPECKVCNPPKPVRKKRRKITRKRKPRSTPVEQQPSGSASYRGNQLHKRKR